MASENGSIQLPDKRIRTLTEKSQQDYEENIAKYQQTLTRSWASVDKALKEHVNCHTLSELKQYQRSLCLLYGEYRVLTRQYSDYLDSVHTADSLVQLETRVAADRHRDDDVDAVLKQTDRQIENFNETRSISVKSNMSQRSDKSVSSQRSRSSRSSTASLTTQAKAKAKAALARKSLIEKETALLKKRVDIEGEIKALKEDEIVKAAEAELEVYKQETIRNELLSSHGDFNNDLQKSTKYERTRQYVESLNDQQSVSQHTEKTVTTLNPEVKELIPQKTENNLASELSRFLLRKELLLSSLTKFDDKPENYPVWKTSFKSVIQELSISVREELDLLVKWLGADSRKNAISPRASSSSNPESGLGRLWDRLYERFGSPEIVESSLRQKLDNFPKLGVKDSKKLFEIVDILDEIQNHMADPKYADFLSYFNTSRGVIPIVNKLPYNIQEKWTSKAARYKSVHHVSFPPFSVFTDFVREISKVKNDPGFLYESRQNAPNQSNSGKLRSLKTTFFDKQGIDNTEKPEQSARKFLSNSDTSIRVEQDVVCPYHNVYGHTLNSCRSFIGKPLSVRKQFIKDKGICFRCCERSDHRASNCHQEPLCRFCKGRHAAAMHVNVQSTGHKNGGENEPYNLKAPKKTGDVNTACTQLCETDDVNTACTQLCKSLPGEKSCARVVCVNVYSKNKPEHKVKMYALLDDQSNKTLAKSEFFEAFGGQFEEVEFSISSCSGKINTSRRKAFGFIVESLDGLRSHELPGVTECAEIPDLRDEIPTAEVAKAYPHLRDLAESIPELDNQAQVLLLIGRDLTEAHHVLQQRIGQRCNNCEKSYKNRLNDVPSVQH